MQPLAWYFHRLRVMSPTEIAWRLRSECRDVLDRGRLHFGLHSAGTAALGTSSRGTVALSMPGFNVSHLPLGAWKHTRNPEETVWATKLINHADALLAHRFSFFDLKDIFLGSPIDW